MFIVEDQLMEWTLTKSDDHYSILKYICTQSMNGVDIKGDHSVMITLSSNFKI